MIQNELQQENVPYHNRLSLLSSSNNMSTTNMNIQESQLIRHNEKVLLKKLKKIQKRKDKKKQKKSVVNHINQCQQVVDRKQSQQEKLFPNNNSNVNLVSIKDNESIEDNENDKKQVQNDKDNQGINIYTNQRTNIVTRSDDKLRQQQKITVQQMQIVRKSSIVMDSNIDAKQQQVTNNRTQVVNKNIITARTKLQDIGFVVYQKQFQLIYQQLNSFIQKSINNYNHLNKINNHNSNEKQHNYFKNQKKFQSCNNNNSKNIILIGQQQSGKKHLVNQMLIKLYCQWNNNNQSCQSEIQQQPVNKKDLHRLSITKRFVNQQNVYLLDDSQIEKQSNHSGNQCGRLFYYQQKQQQQQQHQQQQLQQHKQLQQLQPISSSSIHIQMRVNFISNILNKTNSISQLQQIINQNSHNLRYQKQTPNNNSIVFFLNVNVYLLTKQQFLKLSSNRQQHINQIQQQTQQQNKLTLSLPAFALSTNSNSHSIMIKRLQQFFVYNIKQIESKLNNQLNHVFKYQKVIVSIQYNLSVIVFTTKYIIKKYQEQNNKSSICHPISALRYLYNYLYNHYKAQIKQYQFKSNNNHSDQINTHNHPIPIIFKLTSPIITNFLNTLQSSNHDNPIININFTTLIFAHQIILLACYMYLTSTYYLNSLYINANKLYKFFLLVQQALKIQYIGQKKYWQLLQKLKDLGLLKFCQNIKSQKISSSNHPIKRRSTKNIKFIKDYKNHNFILNFSIEKIKEDLQQIQIYRKFFTEQ